jgi:hypothetical protein
MVHPVLDNVVIDRVREAVDTASTVDEQPTQIKAGIAYPIAPPVLQDMLASEGNASGVLIPVPRGNGYTYSARDLQCAGGCVPAERRLLSRVSV